MTQPIISVGSGMGRLEYVFQKDYKIPIICVDPDPTSFEAGVSRATINSPGLKPDYNLVENLPKKCFDGKSSLFLGWPSPILTYDYDAIMMLKPAEILIVYATCGAAGSSKLHKWLKQQTEYEVVLRENYRRRLVDSNIQMLQMMSLLLNNVPFMKDPDMLCAEALMLVKKK